MEGTSLASARRCAPSGCSAYRYFPVAAAKRTGAASAKRTRPAICPASAQRRSGPLKGLPALGRYPCLSTESI